jgi:hypothetical protein
MAMKGRKAGLVVILLIALATLWPAVLNGGPFYMADTPSYFRGAASVLFKLLHVKTQWTAEFFRLYEGDVGAAATSPSAVSSAGDAIGGSPVTLSGRSVYYGLLLYLSYLAGSVWIIAAVQSLLSATCIVSSVALIGRATGREVRAGTVLAIGIVTAGATSLGYFASYLMPDLFTGLAALAVANLLLLSSYLRRPEKWFWWTVLAFSLLAHSTILMMCTAVVLLWAIYAAFSRPRFNFAPLLGVGVCLAIGALGQVAFNQGVKLMTDHPPVRPPFVAMRMIADGPGYAYLQKHCATEHYIYCRTLAHPRLPSDTLLWSADRNVSLFRGLDPDEQRVSAAQQSSFVTAVTEEKPIEVLTTAARDSIVQLLSFDIDVNFNYSDEGRTRFEKTIPTQSLDAMKRTRAYNDTMPTSFVQIFAALLAVASLLLLLLFVARERKEGSQSLRGYCLCIVAAIIINAAICGALSGPKGRYQMRLVWILPVVAGAIVSRSPRHGNASTNSTNVGQSTEEPA